MTDVPQAAIDAANAWAKAHDHIGIATCNATPLTAFAAGMAAERERIRQLAEKNWAVYTHFRAANTPGERRPFADLLTEGDPHMTANELDTTPISEALDRYHRDRRHHLLRPDREHAARAVFLAAVRYHATQWHDATFDAATDAARAQQQRIGELERTVGRRDSVIAGLRQQLQDAIAARDEALQLASHNLDQASRIDQDLTTATAERDEARERVAQLEGDLAATREPPLHEPGQPVIRPTKLTAQPPVKRPRTARTAPDATGTGPHKAGSAQERTGRDRAAKAPRE